MDSSELQYDCNRISWILAEFQGFLVEFLGILVGLESRLTQNCIRLLPSRPEGAASSVRKILIIFYKN